MERDRLLEQWRQKWKKLVVGIQPNSLRTRLTLGIVLVSALSLGSVAIWMNWKMHVALTTAHKDNVRYLAQRLPKDVEHYSGPEVAATGLQPAIDSLAYEDVMVWVTGPDGQIIAQSMAMSGRSDDMAELLMNLSLRKAPLLEMHEVAGRYLIFCEMPIVAKGTNLGWLHIAEDITADRKLVMGLNRNLIIACILALCLLALVSAWYIRRSLQPLYEVSQVASNISSAEDLTQAHLYLDSAPREIQDLTQTLEQMLFRLAEAWEKQQQFVSNLSHELRTPLTIVDGYLHSVLRRGNNLTELQREGLEVATSEASRTIRLLQDLLDLARADNGYIHLHIEKLLLDDVVQEVSFMGTSCSDRQIELEHATAPIWVFADRDRLKQVLLNLLDNAIRYSDPEHPIKLRLVKGENLGEIQVIDQGQGIALQHQTRIFERFYRVDEARSRVDGGTGLGLSIVKTLVEAMRGKIEVHSQPEEGSTFTVKLPILEGETTTFP